MGIYDSNIKRDVDEINKLLKGVKTTPLSVLSSEQKIFFGTPGSGKSWTIKETYEKDETKVVRTTFHPDTDYAQFVGCYKPKTYEDGDEKKITYEFIPQAFTEAYLKAWSDLENPYYLIIEEINRGNCAQIFGDLFQLLDRNKAGYSEYPIKADHDLRDYLEQHLPKDSEGIKDGKLCLPPNLSIIASMNTSDQSLFPMDSAFKRRWSWEYVPIDYDNEVSAQFKINIDGVPEDWHEFLQAVNEKIKKVTSSEDKQMGNFFIKQSVDEKEFCDKVMFYLWSEVGKDNYQTSDAIFKYYAGEEKEPKEFSFNELYDMKQRTKILKGFIRYIKESEA
ncbi:MAG: AAA family ATPase [Prevotella sp.]|nr:AAA family ATPase [Prevotella sp.]